VGGVAGRPRDRFPTIATIATIVIPAGAGIHLDVDLESGLALSFLHG
jgi:hypothetical protein